MQENATPESTVISEQSTVSTVTPSTVHGSQNSFLVILLSSLLIISVAISGFFAYQTQKLVTELKIKNEELMRSSSAIIKTPEPATEPLATNSSMAVDPTANWKTFNSLMYGFLVKYPQDWLGICKDISGDWTTGSICELRSPNTDPYNTREFITISVEKPSLGRMTLEEIVNFELKNFGNNLSKKSINGIDGYFYTNKDSSVFFTQKGNYFIVINWYPPSNDNKYKVVIDQILSTFKFTN